MADIPMTIIILITNTEETNNIKVNRGLWKTIEQYPLDLFHFDTFQQFTLNLARNTRGIVDQVGLFDMTILQLLISYPNLSHHCACMPCTLAIRTETMLYAETMT